MASRLIALLQARDAAGLDTVLSDSVCFHSPVADYVGRPDVAHLLGLIAGVVDDLQATREIVDSASRVTFIHGLVSGVPVQGVMDECYDEHGLVIDATLMLRPLAALRVAVASIVTARDADPLPSER